MSRSAELMLYVSLTRKPGRVPTVKERRQRWKEECIGCHGLDAPPPYYDSKCVSQLPSRKS